MNVAGDKSLPLVGATCRCGYEGRSRYPDTYMCSACYYGARAEASRKKAKKRHKKAEELDQEAIKFDGQRQKFIGRHPEAGKPGCKA